MNQMGWGFFGAGSVVFIASVNAKHPENFGPGILVGAAFLCIGSWLWSHELREGLLACRLLREGKLAGGRLIHQAAAGWHIQGRTVCNYEFEFEAADGTVHRASTATTEHKRMRDDRLEPVLYDAGNPDRAVVLDALDGPPRIDIDGKIQGASLARAVWVLIVPCAAVLCIIGAVFLVATSH